MLLRALRQRATRSDVKISLSRALSAFPPYANATIDSSSLKTPLLTHVKTTTPIPSPTCQNQSRQTRNFTSGNSSEHTKDKDRTPSKEVTLPEAPHAHLDTNTTTPMASIPATLRIPSNPQSHNSLSKFLKHASHTSLSRTSTTYLGTRYEYLIQTHLSNLAFHLTRTGGKGDFGIDLLGTWDLPHIIARSLSSTPLLSRQSQPRSKSQSQSQSQFQTETETETKTPPPPIKVLIQCKRLRSRAGPNLIRELEGSIRGAPSSFRDDPTTGPNILSILVCSQPATKGIREAMGKSARGLMFAYVEELPVLESASADVGLDLDVDGNSDSGFDSDSDSDSDLKTEAETKMSLDRTENVIPETRMRQLLWNRAAAVRCGLEGLDVGMRYVDRRTNASDGNEKEVLLLWQGRPLDFGIDAQTYSAIMSDD